MHDCMEENNHGGKLVNEESLLVHIVPNVSILNIQDTNCAL